MGVVGTLTMITSLYPVEEVLASKSPTLRVLLLKGDVVNFRVDSPDSLVIKGLKGPALRTKRLKISNINGKLQLFLDGDLYKDSSLSQRDQISIQSKKSKGIWLGKRRYRGKLKVRFGSKSLYVINYLGLETYLQSVVAGEMPKDWPLPALKAQAVAARTYALKQRIKQQKKNSWFDIKSSEASQIYLGIEAETDKTSKAVKLTKSLVMKHNGGLIDAVFHSSSGGITEDSIYVWKKQLPYLLSVQDFDQVSPKYQWDVRFDQDKLRLAFPNISGVTNIKILKISPAGRVLLAEIIGPRGKLTLTGRDIRKRLNLKSTLIRFKFLPYNTFLDSFSGSITNVDSSLENVKGLPTYSMRRSFGFWRDWSLGGERYISENLPYLESLPPVLGSPLPPLAIDEGNTAPPKNLPPLPKDKLENPSLLVSGFGAGHGVGMSQWGAYGLAKKGMNYRQILNHYYSKVNIQGYR